MGLRDDPALMRFCAPCASPPQRPGAPSSSALKPLLDIRGKHDDENTQRPLALARVATSAAVAVLSCALERIVVAHRETASAWQTAGTIDC